MLRKLENEALYYVKGINRVYSRIKRERNVVLTLRCEFLPSCQAGSSLCE